MSRKAKPVFIATGAASMNEVFRTMEVLDYHNLPGICLMQCNLITLVIWKTLSILI